MSYKVPTIHKRKPLIKAYADTMTEYLIRTENIDFKTARAFVKKTIIDKIKRRKITIADTSDYGNITRREVDIIDFAKEHIEHIITPSGSVYANIDEKVSLLKEMTESMVSGRAIAKKEMLRCKAEGDKINEQRYHYEQATIKINTNSLIGGMGSAFTAFYDKGGFNSVTSFSRSLIMLAYATTERLLGSNFYFQNDQMLMNFWITVLLDCPPEEEINHVVNKFNLFIPTIYDVQDKFLNYVKQYTDTHLLNRVTIESFLNSLKPHEIIFLYYTQDLKQIIWKNEIIFKPLITDILNQQNIENVDNVDPSGFLNADSDFISMLTVIFSSMLMEEIEEDGVTKIKNIQKYDVPEKRPDVAKQMTVFTEATVTKLEHLNELFDVFIYTPTTIANIMSQKNMYRNTTALSDTDSVIFTTKAWVKWYTGTDRKLNTDAFKISSLVIYWLTKVIEFTLNRYSAHTGARHDDIKVMKMKNEFLYTMLLLYPCKKTYAGLQMIQEGVVLPKPVVDIKGQQLKGSTRNKETIDTTEKLIIEKILNNVEKNDYISAGEILDFVEDYEKKIYKSLMDGELQYLDIVSVKDKDQYKNPLSSSYFNWMAWTDIFADDYGVINIPTKTPSVSLLSPTDGYFEQLQKKNPKIYKKMIEFKDKYNRYPTAIVLNPLLRTIPEEIRPLIDTRKHIYKNISSMYLTLEALNLATGFKGQQMLLSDITSDYICDTNS